MKNLKKQKIKGLRVRLLRCNHTVPGMLNGNPVATSKRKVAECLSNFDSFVNFYKTHAQAVVVSVRWTSKMYPVAGVLEDASFDNQQGGVEYHKNPSSNLALTDAGEWSTNGKWKKQAVWTFLGKLIAAQKQVFVVYPVPEVGWDLPLYNFATYLQTGDVHRDVSTSHALYKSRNKFILETLDDQRLDAAVRIRPEEYLCEVDWKPFYYDSNHLSSEGAKPITYAIGRAIAAR